MIIDIMCNKIMRAACAAVYVLTAAVGCQKNVTDDPVCVEKVKLQVSVPFVQSKTVTEVDDATVLDYQALLFNEDGILEDFVHETIDDIVLECTIGKKTVVVLVNAPVYSDISTFQELKNKMSYLTDNWLGEFVMEGMTAVEVSSAPLTKVEIPVYRKVAKVELQSLNVRFNMPQYMSMPFTVSSVYLINVPAAAPYFSTSESPLWFNKSGYVEEDDNTLIYDDMGDVRVSDLLLYKSKNVFYCYPNNSTMDSFSPTWSPRHTRLVVEAKLGDRRYYYPVTLPTLESNKKYSVSLTITRPGSDTPDSVVDKNDGVFSIEVQDWDDGGLVDTEI